MQDFRKLVVWSRAHQLTLTVYELTKTFPREEVFALTSQMRRAASSVPANIAEGCGREGPAELARFIQTAAGSASELQYHLLLARDLGYISPDSHATADREVAEIKMMLSGFSGTVRNARRSQPIATKLITDN
jgi:four helix bundle protein